MSFIKRHQPKFAIAILFSIIYFQSIFAFAYDAKIKDQYGKVTGYIVHKGDRTYIIDKYGKRGDYIEKDGDIKDKYGRRKGKIDRDD